MNRYRFTDPYTYPDSDVLKNRLGVTDPDELEAVERRFFALRSRFLPDLATTKNDLLQLHRHLFGDVYEWAGKFRAVGLSRSTTVFCQPEFIERELDTRLEAINAENTHSGSDARDYAGWLAEQAVELNMIHPFREGNGRTLRIFLTVIAAKNGVLLDLTLIDRMAWMQASIAGVQSDYAPMPSVLGGAMREVL